MFKVTALTTACVLGLASACTTTTTAPAQPHIAGQWQLDKDASDEPDAKIEPAIDLAESKLRKRLVNAGFSQYEAGGPSSRRHGGEASNGGAALNGDEYSQTGYIGPDFAELRIQLRRILSAPLVLTIDVQPDYVRLSADSAPARDYPAGEDFTRIDEYGAARIETGWSGNAFVLHAKYASRATVIERYAADQRTGALTVERDVNDPIAGKISVRSIYRK
jgi:hypothetical protein